MVEYVEVKTERGRAAVTLSSITFVVGSGKSLFLETLYKVVSSVGRKVPRIGRGHVYLQDGDVSYALSVERGRVRQSVSARGEELVFEWIPGKSIHRLVKPIDMAVLNADVVMPEVKTQEHVSIVAEEDLERLNQVVNTARRRLGVRALFLGPYISPKSLVDASTNYATLDRHARNLVGVLAYLSLYKPTAYESLKTHLRKLGFSLSVGWAKPGKLGALISTKSVKIPVAKAPCSVKAFLAVATALEVGPELLLIDNFDFCITPRVAEALSALIKQKKTKIVTEIHDIRLADYFNIPGKTVVEVNL
ncbi:MAG: hypothetical protein ABWK05_03605 [Pyrobaculum sp.]